MLVATEAWLSSHVDMSLLSFVLVFCAVGGASFIRGLTGFGYAILAVPFVALVAPPQVAVIMAILMQLLMGPIGIRKNLQVADRSVVLQISAFACLTTPLGLWILDLINPDLARLLITAIALGSLFLFMLKRAPDMNNSATRLFLVGSSSGVLNGFAAIPGPPVILHFVRDQVPPALSRSSMMVIFFITAIAATGTAWWRGMIDEQAMVLTALTCPIMLLGNHIGSRYFGTVSEPVWRGFVLALLLIAGAVALLKMF